MVERRNQVSRRAAGLWLLAAAGAAGLVALILAWRTDAVWRTAALSGDWKLVSGALRALDARKACSIGEPIGPGRYRVEAAARLASGRITVVATGVTEFEVRAGAGVPVPSAGSLRVEADQGFLVASVEVEPIGFSRLLITPLGLTIESGEVRAGGRLLSTGDTFDFTPIPAPVAASENEEPARDDEDEEPEWLPAGSVVDAATGARIGGVEIRAVFFHGAELATIGVEDTGAALAGFGSAGGISGAAAFPPLDVETLESDADGTFSLPAIFPDDPRLSVYLEANHPAYAPATAVLSSRADLSGRWREAELRLRRASTVRVEVTGPDGAPIAGAPIRVTGRSAGHSFLRDESVERALDGRLVKLDAPVVRFTDEDGALRVPFSDHAFDFELLHPAFYLYHRSLNLEMIEKVTLVVPLEGPLRLAALARWTERHRVVDSDGWPACGAEVEIALEGMPSLRYTTDDDGWLTVGVTPWPLEVEPLGYRHPRSGILTVLTPELFKRSAPVAFPSLTADVAVNGRRAQRVRLRCVSDEEIPAPIPAEGIALSLDLTLVRRNDAGEAELCGALPPPGSIVEAFVTGFLPSRVVIPARRHEGDDLDVDLGDVPFSRGLSREVILTGATSDALRGTTFVVSVPSCLPDVPAFQHRYPVGSDGRALVSGLAQGAWIFGAEGPRVKSVAGVLAVDQVAVTEPLEVPLELSGEEDVVVAGRVVELAPLECARCEVVERYLIAGAATPVSFPPYALSPDGTFGSVRRLRGVIAVEATVIAPGDSAAQAVIGRGAGLTALYAGELRLRPQTRAEISFVVDGLGRVLPPRNVSLEGEAGLETLARIGIRNRKLIVNDVLPGNYTLRWLGEGGAEETFGLRVTREHTSKVEGVAVRSAHAEEAVAVRIVDSRGASIEHAAARPRPGDADLEPGEPGTVLVVIAPRKPSDFTVSADGFLSSSVRVDAGSVVPTELTLYHPARARARLLDAESREIDGLVAVSWEPLTPARARHGELGSVTVSRGLLEVTGLPPLPLVYTLRLAGSDLAIRREWTLPEPGPARPRGDDPIFDLGTLRFEETRSLTGTVLLPDGSPAPGAVVGLVPRELAPRLPLRDGGVEQALYAAKADATDARFVFDGLPLDFERPLALVAHLHGYEDAIVEPISFGSEPLVLVLEDEARLSIDAGYVDGEVRAAYGFWLEYATDPADEGSRVQLGEVVPQLRGGESFVGIVQGAYRLKWGLRERYEPLPGLWEDASVAPGTDSRIALRIAGRELRGRATLNGTDVAKGWILLTDDPGANGSTRVGRILDGRFVLLDPPDALHAYAAIVPERSPQPLQNIPRGEALPVPVRSYRTASRDASFRLDYVAHSIILRFGDDFLVRHQGAVLSIDYQRWDRTHFEPYAVEEPIEEPTVRLELLQPVPHRIAVRSAKGTLIFSRTVDLKEDTAIDIR